MSTLDFADTSPDSTQPPPLEPCPDCRGACEPWALDSKGCGGEPVDDSYPWETDPAGAAHAR